MAQTNIPFNEATDICRFCLKNDQSTNMAMVLPEFFGEMLKPLSLELVKSRVDLVSKNIQIPLSIYNIQNYFSSFRILQCLQIHSFVLIVFKICKKLWHLRNYVIWQMRKSLTQWCHPSF